MEVEFEGVITAALAIECQGTAWGSVCVMIPVCPLVLFLGKEREDAVSQVSCTHARIHLRSVV